MSASTSTGPTGCSPELFLTGSPALNPGANTIVVNANNQVNGVNDHATASATYTRQTFNVSVTPQTANLAVQLGQTGSLSFTVQNTGNTANTFTIATSCGGGAVASCGTPSPTSTGSLNPQASTTVTLGYTASTTPGATGQVGIQASGTNTSNSGFTNITTPAPTYGVTVTPTPSSTVTTAVSTNATATFTVKNTGNGTNAFTTSATCTGAAFISCGTASPASTGNLLAGASTTISVPYTTTSGYNTSGPMVLSVSGTNTSGTGTLTVSTPTAPSNAPGIATASVNDFSERQESLCLAKALVPHVAYECGDLRIAHALPSVQTFNKVRTPTLLYSSQLAHPHPIVHALVTLDSTKGTPISVTVQLLDGGGVVRGSGTFPVASFAHGVTREVSVGFDAATTAMNFTTNEYTWSVQAIVAYSSTSVTYTGDEFYALVNLNASHLGHGWSIAGIENMHIYTCRCSMIWYSGDGTANYYSNQNTGVSTTFAPLPGLMTRPDTIKTDNSSQHLRFVRYAPHGAKVVFDSIGRHIATVDRIGDSTKIYYTTTTSTDVDSITVPSPSGHLTYTFNYSTSTGFLTSITVPLTGTQSRNVQVAINGAGDMTSITDPDNAVTSFGYRSGADADVITSVTDPRGTITAVTYDAAREIATATLDSTSSGLRYTTQFANADASTLAAALGQSTVSTLITGPRTDVVDTTRIFMNRFNEPIHVRDALGRETFLGTSSATYPAVVTQLTDALGHTTVDSLDPRGNVASETDLNYQVNGVHPTTHYVYDQKWDFATLIDPPLHDSTSFVYDPNTGNLKTQHDNRGSGTTTTFTYGTYNLLTASTLPGGASPDALQYDATLGDISATQTRLGYWTLISRDAIGRDTMEITPIVAGDVSQTIGSSARDTVRREYDPMDRLTATLTIAPTYNNVQRQAVVVSASYDPAGAPTATVQSPTPDPTNLINIVTTYFYDALGRLHYTVHPDGSIDSTHYDADGDAVTLYTRRGLQITQTFDPLDHLLTRSLPAVPYDTAIGVGIPELPLKPWGTYLAFPVPADVQSFTYDPVGRVTEGDNNASHVTRQYDLSGHLLTETQRVATLSTNDFTQHVYQIGYHYDLDSRRIAVVHPSQASPSTTQNTSSFAYDSAGQLISVTTPLGTVVRLGYDLQGLNDTINRPGSNFEQRTYDIDGRWITHLVGVTGTNPPSIRQETIGYDARNKVIASNNVAGINDKSAFYYSAMGQLSIDTVVWTGYSTAAGANGDQPTPTTITTTEQHIYDPLGNRYNSGATFQAGNQIGTSYNHIWTYLQGTGRLSFDASITNYDSTLYDRSGNIYFVYTPYDSITTLGNFPMSDRVTFYSADEMPYHVEARTAQGAAEVSQFVTRVVDDYRYDVFGRRVLVESHRDCREESDGECLISYLRRTVWDGDQELDEIQVPDTAGLAELDVFNTSFDPGVNTGVYLGHDPNTYWGRVAYTNGPFTDQPLGITRLDYTSRELDDEVNSASASTVVFPAFEFLPLWNYHGVMYGAIFADGTHSHCVSAAEGPRCAVVNILLGDVPYNASANVAFRAWHGSLVEDKTDKTGTHYRRERLYDPNTGRFTQEDPAGLAGGLNAYGFGSGDPINFSDPFGLCPGENNNLPCAFTWGVKGLVLGFIGGAGTGALLGAPTGPGEILTVPSGAALGALGGLGVGIIAGTVKDVSGVIGAALDALQSARAGKGRGGNRKPNSDAARIAKKYNLNEEGQDQLHRRIGKQGLTDEEIEEEAQEIATHSKWVNNPPADPDPETPPPESPGTDEPPPDTPPPGLL
ncbi:MAG TPA: RHS repeat-associated core domain-containing protein [Gemmatimonadaceae bacterium]|nr:RHS repeat-associated core domain-containing protein [Gemmatimonadaceae bacterium]